MFCFTPRLRNCLTVNIKNVVRPTDNNNYISSLSRYESCLRKNVFFFSNLQKFSTNSSGKEVEKISQELDFKQAKQNIKTVWYGSIVLAGLGLTAVIFYILLEGLFSSNSPNAIYSKAFDKCIKNDEVILRLGDPIKGHGEVNSRGRRRHVSHVIYEKDGVKYMRMKFYLKGSIRTGTVHLEMEENEKGNYEFRYLIVQIDAYPHTIITVEDNTRNLKN